MAILRLNEASAITWRTTGGTRVLPSGIASLANNDGAVGEAHDLGTTPRNFRFRYRFRTQLNATGTLGSIVDLLMAVGNSTTDMSAMFGATALTLTAPADGRLGNLIALPRPLVIDRTATSDVLVVYGYVELPYKVVQPVIVNRTGVALSATAAHHEFDLTPLYDETV